MKKIYFFSLSVIVITFFCFYEINKSKNINLQWYDPVSISTDTTNVANHLSFYLFPKTKNALFAWQITINQKDTNDDIFYREYIDGKLSLIQNISNNPSHSIEPALDVDHNSNVHLLWGERIGKITRWAVSTDLFYTTQKNGVFLQPVSIYRRSDTVPQRLCWGTPLDQKMKLDKNNNLHIFLTDRDTSSFTRVRHLVKKDSMWSETSIIRYFDAYHDFLFGRDDILHMIMIHAAKPLPGTSDVNSVFYTFSKDYGVTWSDEVLVDRSGSQGAYGLEILEDDSGIIHIIWGKDLNGDGWEDCIYHSMSPDGINWSKPDAIGQGLGGFFEDFHILKDSKNTPYIFFTRSDGMVGTIRSLYYSYFNSNGWSKPDSIYTDIRFFKAAFDEDDQLHVFFLDTDIDRIRKTGKTAAYMHTTNPITSVANNKIDIPDHYDLMQNYPNPFNSSTIIEYSLPKVSFVDMKIYNLSGEIVANIIREVQTAGKHQVSFEKQNIASGVYFYRIKAGDFISTKKMIYLR